MSGDITRRGLLAGSVVVPWLVACGPDAEQNAGVDLQDGRFASSFWPGQDVHWRLAQPTHRPSDRGTGTARAQPLVIALHGFGGDAGWPFTQAHIERHVAATGLAVATVDGGDLYWHARRSGTDTGSMVVEDFLPLMASKGLATDRVGLIGWSMGGYGVLHLASTLGQRRVAGVVAVSAALWQSADDSPAGAFDDRDDFVRNDVFAARRGLAGIPVRLDCGRDDPFIVANRAFARGLPHSAFTVDAGAHTEEFWTAHAGAEMSWLQQRFQ